MGEEGGPSAAGRKNNWGPLRPGKSAPKGRGKNEPIYTFKAGFAGRGHKGRPKKSQKFFRTERKEIIMSPKVEELLVALLSVLPDSGRSYSWDWCWNELREDEQDAVKQVRTEVVDYLQEYWESEYLRRESQGELERVNLRKGPEGDSHERMRSAVLKARFTPSERAKALQEMQDVVSQEAVSYYGLPAGRYVYNPERHWMYHQKPSLSEKDR